MKKPRTIARRDADRAWDVVVIGAGPAGAVAAHEAARRGAEVLLVDRKSFPRRKVCGGCLNDAAVTALSDIGLSSWLDTLGAPRTQRLELATRGRRLALDLPGMGIAVSRERLDEMLVAAAAEQGASFLPETRALVEGIEKGYRRVRLEQGHEVVEVAARVVILATGLGSRLAAGEETLDTTVERRSRIGLGAAIESSEGDYPPGAIFMNVAHTGYVGVTRLEDGRINVAAALDVERTRREGADGAIGRILDEAGAAPIRDLSSADWQGTPLLTRRTRQLAAERLFVIGDAAGYVEPFTGEGMEWAIRSGLAVAEPAIETVGGWRPELERRWSRIHAHVVTGRQWKCRVLATLLRHPRMIDVSLRILSASPRISNGLVNWMVPRRVRP
ncbi:Putative oxidoreductase [Planctomycetes bacterium Pan216]|uniref:Oxidoreductase n=1 Tax=Kolteria novifilia TaxID=2527975 RepID=A0A518B2G6_9BACT|nr:Putative oxidoreductase [Planctomycetes bacterium Pan216]